MFPREFKNCDIHKLGTDLSVRAYYAAFNAQCVGHNENHLATLTLVAATEMGNFGVVQ